MSRMRNIWIGKHYPFRFAISCCHLSSSIYSDDDDGNEEDEYGNDVRCYAGREYGSDGEGYASRRYYEEDAGDDWEDEVVVRRTPRNARDNFPVVRR